MPNLYRANSNDRDEELNREEKKTKKKKFDFGLYKNNTLKSLNEVEYFLKDFNHFSKYIKLYKIFKK